MFTLSWAPGIYQKTRYPLPLNTSLLVLKKRVYDLKKKKLGTLQRMLEGDKSCENNKSRKCRRERWGREEVKFKIE